jgi:hypothetical protein
MICQKKSLHDSCRMGRRIVVMKLICSLGHCECDGHTVNKLSQRRLTADLVAPRESDCSRMHSKVSSDWLTAKLHHGHATGSRDIQNGCILSGQHSFAHNSHNATSCLTPATPTFSSRVSSLLTRHPCSCPINLLWWHIQHMTHF